MEYTVKQREKKGKEREEAAGDHDIFQSLLQYAAVTEQEIETTNESAVSVTVAVNGRKPRVAGHWKRVINAGYAASVLSREVQRVGTLEDLCRGCDYLTVHVPSKADTIGMISTEQINLLAPDAVLINYARETIIDEDAVDAALREGRLSWFSCDFATPKTVKMPNTFITTHSGAGTGEAEANCADMAISELKDYLENGNIAHSVNYPACSMGKARAASRIACLHANVPNMIGQITAILAKDNANVQRMTNESAGENAYTMFDTDEHLDSSTIEALKQIPSMYRVRVIK